MTEIIIFPARRSEPASGAGVPARSRSQRRQGRGPDALIAATWKLKSAGLF